ncbi:unnamed protein product, partial [Boreogadus saida]
MLQLCPFDRRLQDIRWSRTGLGGAGVRIAGSRRSQPLQSSPRLCKQTDDVTDT